MGWVEGLLWGEGLRKKVEQEAKPVPSAAKAEQICNHIWTA